MFQKRVVVAGTKSSIAGQVFPNAQNNSAFHKLWRSDKITNESFLGFGSTGSTGIGLKMVTMSQEPITVFGETSILDESSDRCELKFAWISSQAYYSSFAFGKNSPFLPFFNHALSTLRENGSIERLKNKWNMISGDKNCNSRKISTIEASLRKVILIPSILAIGIGLTIILSCMEYIFILCKMFKERELIVLPPPNRLYRDMCWQM